MKKNVQKDKEEVQEEVLTSGEVNTSELSKLVTLLAELKALGVNSIGDLEVRIARLQ